MKLRTIRDIHGKTLQISEWITKGWTEYCQKLFKNTNIIVNAEFISLRKISPKQNPSTFNNHFPKSEIHATINKLNSRKSSSSDRIPAEIIRAGGNILEEQMSNGLNRWESYWKMDKINSDDSSKKGDVDKLCNDHRWL